MVRAEVVQAVDVSMLKQIVDVRPLCRNSCWFFFSLVHHEGTRRSSAPTGLAVRSETLLWASWWIVATLRRTQLPLFKVSVASCFPSFRLAGPVLTEHLTKICTADPSAKVRIESPSVQTWATHLLEGLRVQDAVASRCTLSLCASCPCVVGSPLVWALWSDGRSLCAVRDSQLSKNPADSGFNRFELAVLALRIVHPREVWHSVCSWSAWTSLMATMRSAGTSFALLFHSEAPRLRAR